jgi:hypothetical protein
VAHQRGQVDVADVTVGQLHEASQARREQTRPNWLLRGLPHAKVRGDGQRRQQIRQPHLLIHQHHSRPRGVATMLRERLAAAPLSNLNGKYVLAATTPGWLSSTGSTAGGWRDRGRLRLVAILQRSMIPVSLDSVRG